MATHSRKLPLRLFAWEIPRNDGKVKISTQKRLNYNSDAFYGFRKLTNNKKKDFTEYCKRWEVRYLAGGKFVLWHGCIPVEKHFGRCWQQKL